MEKVNIEEEEETRVIAILRGRSSSMDDERIIVGIKKTALNAQRKSQEHKVLGEYLHDQWGWKVSPDKNKDRELLKEVMASGDDGAIGDYRWSRINWLSPEKGEGSVLSQASAIVSEIVSFLDDPAPMGYEPVMITE